MNRKSRRAALAVRNSDGAKAQLRRALGHSSETVEDDLAFLAGEKDGEDRFGNKMNLAPPRASRPASSILPYGTTSLLANAPGGHYRRLPPPHQSGSAQGGRFTRKDAEDLVDGRGDDLLKRFKSDSRYSAEEHGVMEKVVQALSGLSSRVQCAVLDSVQATHGKFGATMSPGDNRWMSAGLAIVAAAEEAHKWQATAAAQVDAMEPELRRISREWHAPPGSARNAQNLEVLAMNSIRFSVGLGKITAKHCGTKDDGEELKRLELMAERDMVFLKALNASSDFAHLFADGPMESAYSDFGQAWIESSFARLEVGHKLAASLCLTDIPEEMEVRAPWAAWSLIVPPGLFPPLIDEGQEMPARFWCLGTEPVFIIASSGRVLARAEHPSGPVYDAMMALIKGACLALSNPEDFRKERQHRPSARAAKTKRAGGAPDFEQARFLLSAPVKIDLREHLASVLSGRKGSSPTVQFLVRGHWKNQAHGPRMSLRKPIFVEAFWKGEEGTRVLLRQVKVDR